MAVLGVTRDPATGRLSLPTELATTAWGLLGGVGAGLAQIVVARRLSEVPSDTVALRSLAVPVAASFVGTILGGFLVPRS